MQTTAREHFGPMIPAPRLRIVVLQAAACRAGAALNYGDAAIHLNM